MRARVRVGWKIVASSERWVRSTVVAALSFAFTGLVLRNVLSDNEAVVEQARQMACEKVVLDTCRVSRVDRGPFAQRISLSVGKRSAQVECTREYWLVGEYKCAVNP
jgi:hypothetical protein